jgi:subtilase family serine protease
MRRPPFAALAAVAALCLSTLALAPSASAAPASPAVAHRHVHVCGAPAPGTASCDAIRDDLVDAQGQAAPQGTTVRGYVPADIRSAYGLTSASSGGKTVAIVDAYDDPYAEADLKVYRDQFGLPACTSAGTDPCFRKVGQTGGAVPRANAGWSQEISLDLDMVSAACPDCKILLVEAKSASFADLSTAVNYAASQGVVAISNSYGGSDSNTASTVQAYNHPGIAVTASSGDNGYEVESPASFPTVIAVGGTSLTKTSAGAWTEAAWSGAGSGCSTLNANSYQDETATSCAGHKATADVSAVADPNTGVAVYDSYAYQGSKGWLQFGGTSASSPIVASVYAMGTAVAPNVYPGKVTWSRWATDHTVLHDVTSGSNGTCPTITWCDASTKPGWDGPTGLGTPKGVAAF